MDSFGVFFKLKSSPTSNDKISKPSVNLHINLWDLKEGKCYIDLGLWVYNPELIDRILFSIPFLFNQENDLQDLTSLPLDQFILIFNREVSEKNDATLGKHSQHTRTLEIKDSNNATPTNGVLLIPITSEEIKITTQKDEYTFIEISSSAWEGKLKENTNNLYLRFRLKNVAIRESLLSSIVQKNWGFEYAFNSTVIVDLKINERRNMESVIANELFSEFTPVNFDRIDFFLMEPAARRVESVSSNVECRKLEEEWNSYIGEKDPLTDMLAYQWTKKKKVKGNDKPSISSYSQLVKVTLSKKNSKIITAYCLAVIILSIIGNSIFSFFVYLSKNL